MNNFILGEKLNFEEILNLEEGTKVYIKELREFSCCESSLATKRNEELVKDLDGRYYTIRKTMFLFDGEEDMQVYEICEKDKVKEITKDEAFELKEGTKVFVEETDKERLRRRFSSVWCEKKGSGLRDIHDGTSYCKYSEYEGLRFYIKKENEKKEDDEMIKVGDKMYIKEDLLVADYDGVSFVQGMMKLRGERVTIKSIRTNSDSKVVYEVEEHPWVFSKKMLQKENYSTPLKTEILNEVNGIKIGDRVKTEYGNGTVIDFTSSSIGVALDEESFFLHDACIGVNGNKCFNHYGWWFKNGEVELIGEEKIEKIEEQTQEIKIEKDNRKTTVTFDGNVGVSKCNPDDDFNEKIGVGLALKRLGEKLIKQGEDELKSSKELEKFDVTKDLKGFMEGEIVVLCNEQKSAEKFLNILNALEVVWHSGRKVDKEVTRWDVFGDKTCYAHNLNSEGLGYGSKGFYKNYKRVEKIVKF